MKKKIIIRILCLCVIILGLAAAVVAVRVSAGRNRTVEAVSETDRKRAFELLQSSMKIQTVRYPEFLADNGYEYGKTDAEAICHLGVNDSIEIDYAEGADYTVEIEKEGLYQIELSYRAGGTALTDYLVEVSINGKKEYEEMGSIILPLSWSDATKEFPKDSFGDEIAVAPVRSEEWQTSSLYNTAYYTVKPLLFYFNEGTNLITIKNISNDGLQLGKITVKAPDNEPASYAEYRSLKDGKLIGEQYCVNAVDYSAKNSTTAIMKSQRNPALYPYDGEYKKLNTISEKTTGTTVEYKLEVPETGFYHLSFHYKNAKEDFSVFQSIRIDGEIPFQELSCYEFTTTDNEWKNETLSDQDGKPYEIYLTEGVHTLTLKSEQEPVTDAWREGRLIAEHVTQFALEIKKITGAQTDKNRTWKMTKYIPQIEDYLDAYDILIQDIRYRLQDYAPNGIKSAKLSNLSRALVVLEMLKEYPDEIALHTENLIGNSVSADNSILKLLGDFSSSLMEQPFELDMIYYGSGELPREDATIFQSIGSSLSGLFYSFTSEKYNQKSDPEELEIWVNRAVTHVDLLQKMVDSEFTKETGIKVKISLIPDVNKLTLAAAAKGTPDVALGLSSFMPFDLSCRGALYDMSQFDDFWQVAGNFTPGAFVPYVFNEGVYALPETSDFNLLIYRTDIFENIGIEAPSTWQDVKDILPELQRYGMNFYHNIATNIGYKWFYQTTPMLLQHGGKIYSEDGLTSVINEPDAVSGIKYLGELFSLYSIPSQIPQFNDSFRYSILPIGITDLTTYNLIKNGAPELEGQWALSCYPGTVKEDGSIDRSYVAAGSGAVIFEASDKKDDAWKFLKWWLSHDIQVEYAHTLQSTYGKENIWLPSNLSAIEDCTLPTEDKLVILEQLKYLQDVPRTPGQYLAERALSDIWNQIAVDGSSAQVAVDAQIMDVQREMRKKMQDFGFIDKDGTILKPYVIHDVSWIREKIEQAKEDAR